MKTRLFLQLFISGRRRLPGLALGGAVLSLCVAAPSPAAAAEISCGAVVTEDVRLSHDLLDCPGTGIAIGADGITLDLGGHTVSGIGGEAIGIDNRDGHDRVRIVNGTVRRFGVGIFLAAGRFGELQAGADRNELSDLTVSDNDFTGIDVFYSTGVLVTRSTIHNNDFGLELVGGERNRVASNTFSNDDDPIRRRDSAVSAIGLGASDHNEVVANVTSVHLFGIRVDSSAGNDLVGNAVSFSEFAGVSVFGGDGNELRKNAVNDNVDRPGGQEGLPGDGIVVDSSFGTRLIRNEASRNGDDGIDVEASGTTLLANEANLNGDLGIEAVAGVHAAGNRASGNGNPLQCLNVSCITAGGPLGQLDAEQAAREARTPPQRSSAVERLAVRE